MNGTCDDRLIDALLSEPSIAAAARAAGVSRQTLYTRLHDAEFVAQLEAERAIRRDAIRAQSVGVVTAAVEALGDVLGSPLGPNTAERLRAAEIALRHLRE